MNMKKSCRFLAAGLAAVLTLPSMAVVSQAEDNFIFITDPISDTNEAHLEIKAYRGDVSDYMYSPNTLTFTVTSRDSSKAIAPSTIRVRCKKGDQMTNPEEFPLDFYTRSNYCYATYRLTKEDITNYPGRWEFYLDSADQINMTEFKAKAVVEDDDDVKKLLRSVSIRGSNWIRQGDEVQLKPHVSAGLYAENLDYRVKYANQTIDSEFKDGYIVFTAPTIAPGDREPDRDKDEYEFEVSAWEKGESSVTVFVDSSAKNIVRNFDWDPKIGLRGTEVTVTAELNEYPALDYQLLLENTDNNSEQVGVFTRKATSSPNTYLYECKFRLPSITVDDYGYEDYDFKIAYEYRYDYDYDIDRDDLPTINGMITEWDDVRDAIKNASSKVTELDIGNNTTIPASTVKAITDVAGISDRSVEIRASKDAKLIIDKESVSGIDSTKAITFDQQSVTVKPAVEDKVRGTAEMSFKASNVNGVKAQLTLKDAKDGEFANLYLVNSSNKAEFVTTAKVSGGKVTEKLAGDGQYIVMTGSYSDLKGDANNDGTLNVRDAVDILKQNARVMTPINGETFILDYNKDGKINAKDAVGILKFAAGVKE